MKITRENWNEVLNNPPMKFETFCNGSHCKTKTMKSKTNFNQIRYVEPEDVIYAIKKRIENQLNQEGIQARNNRLKWLKITKSAQALIDKAV